MHPKQFGVGLVVGKFAPLHLGHLRVLEAASAACDRVIVMVWSEPDFPEMPTSVRAGRVQTLASYAEVLAFPSGCGAPRNDAPSEAHHAFVRAHLPVPVDAVFTSEAYGPAFAAALGAVHIAVDPERRAVPISGTAIRADPQAHRAYLPEVVGAHFVRRVVVMGAESSGKSTLVEALARHFDEPFVEEVGRTLWEAAGGALPLIEYETICREHVALEEARIREAQRFLFVDTNAITTQQYAFFFYGECPAGVQAYAARCRERYAHTFVCAADFPFRQDGTRVNPQVQQYMDGAIRNDLTVRGISYTVLGGSVEERIRAAEAVLGA